MIPPDTLWYMNTLCVQIQCLDAERICQEQSLEKYRSTTQAQKAEISSMEVKLAALSNMEAKLNK